MMRIVELSAKMPRLCTRTWVGTLFHSQWRRNHWWWFSSMLPGKDNWFTYVVPGVDDYHRILQRTRIIPAWLLAIVGLDAGRIVLVVVIVLEIPKEERGVSLRVEGGGVQPHYNYGRQPCFSLSWETKIVAFSSLQILLQPPPPKPLFTVVKCLRFFFQLKTA